MSDSIKLAVLADYQANIRNYMCRHDCDKLTFGTGECRDCILLQLVEGLGTAIADLRKEDTEEG